MSWRAGSSPVTADASSSSSARRAPSVPDRQRGDPGVRALVTAILDAGLPEAHAGIAVGRFVVRDGDVYGNVVNLAARIATHAQPGEVLLPIEDAAGLLPPAAWFDAGEAALKGIPQPVAMARVRCSSS